MLLLLGQQLQIFMDDDKVLESYNDNILGVAAVVVAVGLDLGLESLASTLHRPVKHSTCRMELELTRAS